MRPLLQGLWGVSVMNPSYQVKAGKERHKRAAQAGEGLRPCPRCGQLYPAQFEQVPGGWSVQFGCCGHTIQLDNAGNEWRPERLVDEFSPRINGGYHQKGKE